VTPRPLTVGTAGHVDHGKTRLVYALTGKDTDRLPEERARGISIELGFAPLEIDGRRFSLIDVPGHERLVRTMVAGATGIDLFLLVVDAHEGPRAQTYEHLAILRLLGVTRGVVAVTKTDAADPDRVAHAVADVAALVPEAAVVPVSAVTGHGMPELRRALLAAADDGSPSRSGPARLYVDRVFSLPGAGTVVTGTLRSGQVSVGDVLDVMPAGFSARVRSIEVHDEPVTTAASGQRLAIALVTRGNRRPRRGDALVEPGSYLESYRLDLAIDELEPIADGARISLCHGTSVVPCRICRVGDRYAQARLERPVVAARDDRVILRSSDTLGGARVLDPAPPRQLDETRLRLLDSTDPAVVLCGMVSAPARTELLRARAGFDIQAIARSSADLGEQDGWVFAQAWLERTRAEPLERRRAAAVKEPWGRALNSVLGLTAAAQPAADAPLGAEARMRADQLEALLAGPGIRIAPIDDAALAARLERDGIIRRLGRKHAVSVASYEEARVQLIEECVREGTVSLARFRDMLGCSRQTAQLLLERFDTDGVTLRVGDARRLRRSATTSH
jgi:selenocysteine-specific elongation factor